MRRAIILALALAAGASAAAHPGATPSRYLIEVTIRSADGKVDTPSLLVDVEKSAAFMKADKGYWFKMMARPHASGRVEVDLDRVVSLPQGLMHYGSSIELQAGGEPSEITSGDVRFTVRARAAD
jgi:hypothetical protein